MSRARLLFALVLAAASLTLWSGPARAEFSSLRTATARSPQHFAFEIKFGPYSPDIDSTPGLNGKPFSDLFIPSASPDAGTGARPPGRLLTTIEFDWQIWHGFGSLGLGASVGIMHRYTLAFQYNNGNSCTVPNCVRSADETALNMMPFSLEAVYRFDVLAERWRIPIVPYLKGGISYYLWWITNGRGEVATGLDKLPDGSEDKARGGVFGLVAHPGVALLLDVLEPGAAATMDSELGINHTYLFFEMNYAWVTGFGSGQKIVMSDLTWNAGLAFEF